MPTKAKNTRSFHSKMSADPPHGEMIAELPWPVWHGRALADRRVAVNVEVQKLTQRLMTVTQRAVMAEQAVRGLEAEMSARFASVEGRCLDKLESILEEYSACLTYAPTLWALLRELIRKDGVSAALSGSIIVLKGQGSGWSTLCQQERHMVERPRAGRQWRSTGGGRWTPRVS